MKKIITTFLLTGLFAFSAYSQSTIFQEDFESSNDMPTSFITIDGDGNTVHNSLSSFFPPAWNRLSFQGDPNGFMASTSQYTPAGQSDDWVIIPNIMLGNGTHYLFWDARSGSTTKLENYQVLISTTGTDTNDFSVLATINGETTSWNSRSSDLTAAGYNNQTIHLAFRNISFDKYVVAVDNIAVKEMLDTDLSLSSINKKARYMQNESVTVSATVVNKGLNPITAFDLNWSTDGGATVNTYSLSGLSLNLDGSMTVSHPDQFTTGNSGSKANMEVWISNVNNANDDNSSNDSLSQYIYASTTSTVNKKVLLEEFTTAICQFCPDGAVKVEEAVNQNPEIIPVGVHSGFGTDAMTIPAALDYANFTGGAPTAMVNRRHFIGESDVAFSRATQLDNNLWMTRANSEAATGAPLSIDIRGDYNSNTRTADVTISSDFVDYPYYNDVRVTLFVVEDSVTGVGSGYNQINAYNTAFNYYPDGSDHEYAGKGNPIVGYIHRHVLRDVYPTDDAWGDANAFPSNITLNNTYDQTYTVTLDNGWDEDQVKLIAFVSYYDEENLANREILNVTAVDIQEMWAVGIEEHKANVEMEVYPNPFKNETNIGFTLEKTNEVSIQMYDVAGKLMLDRNLGKLNAGEHLENIQVGDMESGFYFIKLNVGNSTVMKKVSLLK